MPTRRTEPSNVDVAQMRRACRLAAQCTTEPGRGNESPKVAAIALDPTGAVIAEARRGEDPEHPGDHAEYMLVVKSGGPGSGALRGATVFTTLEPCTERSRGKIPCAQRLIDERVSVVYIGMFDPDPRVRELGAHKLRAAGIDVRDFTADTRADLMADNEAFIARYQRGSGESGTAQFDYTQNGGRYDIYYGDTVFRTRWTTSGKGSIQALGTPGELAIARYADIDEIDDPDAYEFTGHVHRPKVGQVVIYRSNGGFCLVRISDVKSGPDYGDDRTEVTIAWRVRAANQLPADR